MIQKPNYKLVNFALFLLIIYLIYKTSNVWFGVVSILFKILLPFLIAFALAYALNPIVIYLKRQGLNKKIAIFSVLFLIFIIISLIFYLIVPILFTEISKLFEGIIFFFKEVSLKNNFFIDPNNLSTFFSVILTKIGTYISDGAIDLALLSINIVSNILIIVFSLIYFLIDMDKIKLQIKRIFKNNDRIYGCLKQIDKQLENYLSGFIKIVFISFFEYTILYYVIGHPNYLVLGFLAAISNLLPYFGGIFTNIIAIMTAFTISPSLFIKTIILLIIFSALDGYLINPYIYGKTNKIHPLLIIISIFIGGILLGFIGIIIALPSIITLMTIFNYFKEDIKKIVKT